MKLVLMPYFILISLLGLGVMHATPLDRVIVVVNDRAITEKDVDQELIWIQHHLQSDGASVAKAQLRAKAIRSLIEDTSTLSVLGPLSEEYSAYMDTYIEQRVQAGQYPSLLPRIKLKEKLLLESYYSQMGTSEALEIDEAEIEAAMRHLPSQVIERFSTNQYHIELLSIPIRSTKGAMLYVRWVLPKFFVLFRFYQHIVPHKPSRQSIEDAHQQARDALEKAKKGISFAQLVSQSPYSMPWKVRTEVMRPTQSNARLLKAAEAAGLQKPVGPFERTDVFCLARLKAISGPVKVRVRHILLRAKGETDADIKARLLNIRQRCLQGEDFRKQVEQYSEDPHTLFKEGELGWELLDALGPIWSPKIATLQPNQISLPFKTQEGWHIVQLLERKPLAQDYTELKRLIAKMTLHQNKMHAQLHELRQTLYADAHIKWIDTEAETAIEQSP